MANVTKRRTGEFLRHLFEILIPLPVGMPAQEALALVEKRVTLTPYESGNYDSGSRRFETIIRFATVDCVKAGWLVKNKGRWSISDAGRAAYSTYKDPDLFYRNAVNLFHEWKASQPENVESEVVEVADDESGKIVGVTFEQAEEQAWSEIQRFLGSMNPYDFQELVASLLRAMGYYVSWVAPPGKDGGLDILASTDPLGTRPPRIKVQVKRQTQTVSVDGLRSFLAVVGQDDVGIFVSTGGFTKDAEQEARTNSDRKVTLLNLEGLFDLWVEYYGRLSDDARRRFPLRPVHFLAPEP
jgi:restriction system protein